MCLSLGQAIVLHYCLVKLLSNESISSGVFKHDTSQHIIDQETNILIDYPFNPSWTNSLSKWPYASTRVYIVLLLSNVGVVSATMSTPSLYGCAITHFRQGWSNWYQHDGGLYLSHGHGVWLDCDDLSYIFKEQQSSRQHTRCVCVCNNIFICLFPPFFSLFLSLSSSI